MEHHGTKNLECHFFFISTPFGKIKIAGSYEDKFYEDKRFMKITKPFLRSLQILFLLLAKFPLC